MAIRTVQEFIQALKDGNPYVRRNAAWALGRIGPPAQALRKEA